MSLTSTTTAAGFNDLYSLHVETLTGITKVYVGGRLDHIVDHGTGRVFR